MHTDSELISVYCQCLTNSRLTQAQRNTIILGILIHCIMFMFRTNRDRLPQMYKRTVIEERQFVQSNERMKHGIRHETRRYVICLCRFIPITKGTTLGYCIGFFLLKGVMGRILYCRSRRRGPLVKGADAALKKCCGHSQPKISQVRVGV